MVGVQRGHLVEGDLQHDRQGQVAVEQGHTVGEAQAFPRRRRQQQPVDRGVRIPSGVQAHLHVGSGRDLHLPHGERDSRSRPRSFLQRPGAFPGLSSARSLRFNGDANSARGQPAGSRRPPLQSPAPSRPGTQAVPIACCGTELHLRPPPEGGRSSRLVSGTQRRLLQAGLASGVPPT